MNNDAPMLPIRRENEILVDISGMLIEQLVEGLFTVEDIQKKLRQFVAVYGVGETDEFFVNRVSAFFNQGN